MTSLLIVSCAKNGTPSSRAELWTAEQIKSLPKDASMNKKQISAEGYLSFCDMYNGVTMGKNNVMELRTEPDCKGEKLIDVSINFNTSEKLFGEKYRNYATVEDKTFNNSSIKFMTDDYQEVPNGKLKFSGTLLFVNGHYELQDVVIYQ